METGGRHEPMGDYVTFDPATLSRPEQYALLTGAIVPRPVTLVTTLGPHGLNAAPYSFVTAIGSDPSSLLFTAGRRGDAMKDTIRNIRDTGEFVVHIVDVALRDKMNVCGIEFGPSVNEAHVAGLRTTPSIRVRPPRLVDCPIQLECKLMQIVPVGHYDVVFGEVVTLHFRSDIMSGRLIDFAKLDPLGRLSGPDYAHMSAQIQMPRLPVPPGMEPAADEWTSNH